jgi:DNA-directed RNA polymerase subunit omega
LFLRDAPGGRERRRGHVEERERELMEAVSKAGSSSFLINIISQRVSQLHRGARPLLEKTAGLTPTEIATKEFLQGKIGYRTEAAE